jgi:DNA-nicking Smr family endonuclease
MARRRRLSSEERLLWDRVAASAIPLHPDRAPSAPLSEAVASGLPEIPLALPPPETPRALPPLMRRAAPEPSLRFDLVSDPRHALGTGVPRMDRRRFDKMRRGRLEPEDRLDLHGMTLERAHPALTRFVLGAHARDLRLVLVITGKGRSDESAITPHRHGILRHSVPHWLATPPLVGSVLDVVPAHQRHGGGGAYYVYLRRRR